jgi:transcriptional regulator with XRE-family HTH domain
MSYAPIVNDHFHTGQQLFTKMGLSLRPIMAEKRKKPGSKKGTPKPRKRVLDPLFHVRLLDAMGGDKDRVPEIAKKVGCSRQALHKHLSGTSVEIEALLLFALCDELEVAPAWLLKNEGGKRGLFADEATVLQGYRVADRGEKAIILAFAERIFKEGRQ